MAASPPPPPPPSIPSTQTSSDPNAILITVNADDGDSPPRAETLARLPTTTTESVFSIHPSSEVQSGTLPRTSAHQGPTNTNTSQSGSPNDSGASGREDIEMDSMAPPIGHRRRRSSLMSPANGSAPQSRTASRGRGRTSIGGESNAGSQPRAWSKGAGDGDVEQEDEALLGEDLHLDEEAGLRRGDRTRKERKRRRSAQLDNRNAPQNLTPEEKKQADKNVVRRMTINCGLILLWYIFSLVISVYNKWMFADDKLNFPFPLFTTALHMLVQFVLATLVLYFVPSMRPQNGRVKDLNGHMSDRGQSRHGPGRDGPIMSKMFYLTRIGPCGAATGLDIGLGNTSLKFITLTFYTMCKSSSLVFVLLFAFIFRLEQLTWRLVAIIVTMTIGVLMMVAGEIEFRLIGFVLVITAAFFSGFRWGLTQILLLRNPATSNPFSSIFFLAPVMFFTLLALAIPLEGFSDLIGGLKHLTEQWGVLPTPFLILFPGVIAFLMTASEFALLQRTSVVTLSIAGIFKEVVTISTATVVFDDKLTAVNISGLFVTIGAICAYNYVKLVKMRSDAQEEVHREHLELSEASMSSGSDGENDDDDNEDARLLQQPHTAERNGAAHPGHRSEASPARGQVRPETVL